MNALDPLIACAGTWRGTNTLHDPHTNLPDVSTSVVRITPVGGGRFVRLDYTWSYQGTPQDGSILFGFDVAACAITGHWFDSWHQSDRVMACVGSEAEGPTISVRGLYAVSEGPDWGWRIDVTPEDAEGRLRLEMFNVWPDGVREEPAVEATYTR